MAEQLIKESALYTDGNIFAGHIPTRFNLLEAELFFFNFSTLCI